MMQEKYLNDFHKKQIGRSHTISELGTKLTSLTYINEKKVISKRDIIYQISNK